MMVARYPTASRKEHKHKSSKRGIGKRVTSEATREGEAVVLAERSTDGR